MRSLAPRRARRHRQGGDGQVGRGPKGEGGSFEASKGLNQEADDRRPRATGGGWATVAAGRAESPGSTGRSPINYAWNCDSLMTWTNHSNTTIYGYYIGRVGRADFLPVANVAYDDT